MTLGENIKRLRQEKGFTQKQLGNLCNPPMADSAIRRYESGKANPKIETIRKIATALGVSDISLLETNENDFDLSGLEFEDQLSLTMRHIIDHPEGKSIIHNIATGEKYRVTAPTDKNALKKYLLLRFEELNDKGKNKLTDYAEDLTKVPEYRREAKVVPMMSKEDPHPVNAAHADDYTGAPEELKQPEEDIRDADDF